MMRWALVILYTALLVTAVRGADIEWPEMSDTHPYLSCSAKRLVSFGSTQREKPIAELAAIVRWRDEAADRGKDFDNWGLAQNRHLSCHRLRGSLLLQCKAAGLPCRPKRG